MQVFSNLREWLPVVGLTLSAFVFNTSEFMPIGLLTDIATTFSLTEARAGMLISVYAWMVALLSLPLMLAVCRMEMRRLLLTVLAVFIVSHVFSAVAQSFGQLMLSRIGVACAHAVFWSIASPMAVRTVPESKRQAALGAVAVGSSVAMVVGLPLGRVIGMYVGWRTTFFCIAVVALVVAAFLVAVFPKMPTRSTFSVRKMPLILGDRVLMGIFLVTVLFATGHYVGYSYIEPFLAQIARMSGDSITLALIVFGAAGALGSVLFSRYYVRRPLTFITLMIGGVALGEAVLHVAALSFLAVSATFVVWSAAATAFNVAFQATIIRWSRPEATSVAMSIFSGIFNLGIGSGAFIGGLVCSDAGIVYIGYVGAAIALLAMILFGTRMVPLMRQH